MRVNTVLGQVYSSELGAVLMHEHILILDRNMSTAYSKWFDRNMFIRHAVQMCRNAKRYGINTIVDATPIDLGRDLSVMREVSEKAEINIIPCTGFYWHIQFALHDKSPEFLAEILVNDIENGIEGTDVKAQFIKYATAGPELTEYDRKLGKAAAIASNTTGAFIYTHTNQKNGMSQVDFFDSEGVAPERLVIGHMGDTDDYEYIQSILDKGHRIGMDRFGGHVLYPENYIEDERRAKTVSYFMDKGYGDGMVLSHDACGFIDYTEKCNLGNVFPEVMAQDLDEYKVQYSYIPKYVFDMFRDCGMNDNDIKRLMVDNPRKIFEKQKFIKD